MPVRHVFAVAALLLTTAALPARSQSPSSGPSLTPVEAKRKEAVEHYLRARLFAQDSEFEEAVKEFRKAIDLDPADGALRREYGELLRDIPIYPEAEREARKAVELMPSSAGAHRLLGQVLLATAKDKARAEEAASELKKSAELGPPDPQGAVALAQAYLRLEKAKEAVAALESVVDRAHGAPYLLLFGEALERDGQTARAEEIYKSLLKQDPENRAASVGLLRVYERSRQFDKEASLLETLVKGQPGNLAARTQYATVLLRARRFPESRKVFEQVLAADPGNREALRMYAALLSETRETDKADEILRKLEALEPDEPDIAYRRAMNFLEARRLTEAERALGDLKKSLPAKKAEGPEGGQIDGQLAYVAYLRKDYARATSLLTPRLWDGDGLNPQAFNLLAQIARDREDWAGGQRLAREAYEKDGRKSPNVRATFAEFLLRSGGASDRAEGEKILAALAAEDKAGILAAADAWQRLDQYARAADVARQGLERDPEEPDLLFRLAASLERDKKLGESEAAFERLLKVRADHAPGMNYLGYMWADRGENLPRALELIRKAVDLEPSNGAYLDSLGWVYFRIGRLDKAEENLVAASTLNPDDATVEEHLGDLWEKKGDLARARESWKRALTLKPETENKSRLEDKLRKTDHLESKK
ncbi:MAG: tetratricopeptide repeat protein [Thermoanaerobaculia bacterium]|jgi:tetratricopeptide (TPR) repeat protein